MAWKKPPPERRCTAIATGGQTRPERKGEQCERWACVGLNVCVSHGASDKARAVGLQRDAEAKLEEQLMAQAARLVGQPVDNPLVELANLAGRARAFMELMQDRVETLLDGDGGHGEGQGDIRYRGGAGEQLRAEVALYERSMDRLGKFLSDYARLGIDERLARISEQQVDAVVAAIDAALNAIGIRDQQQRTTAKRAAGRYLQKVA